MPVLLQYRGDERWSPYAEYEAEKQISGEAMNVEMPPFDNVEFRRAINAAINREELAKHPRLVAGCLQLARCPRVHLKLVIVDGALLYLGSANWTGSGLGAKGTGRRNFELGVVTDDGPLLDQIQALCDHVWTGRECGSCKLRDECPGPLDELAARR